MQKFYIDYEWGVEVPLIKENGEYLKNKDIENLSLDIGLTKMILLWSFAIQNSFNWHNPNDDTRYFSDYYYNFIERLESDIILKLKKYEIEVIKKQ